MASIESGTAPIATGSQSKGGFISPGTLVDMLVLTCLWLVAVVIVKPVGEFPLNDDWSWGMTAKDLAEGKGYRPTSWTEMTLFTHAVWGALFCLPQGFSFTALRISTLVMSLMGALGLYVLVRQLNRTRFVALMAGLVLAFNPIYFALSHTYMADVPFTTLAIGAAIFFVRHLKSGAKLDLGLAIALSVTATLSRQMGLCLPLAFGIAFWLQHGFQRQNFLRLISPAVICVVVLLLFKYWLKSTGAAPANTMRTERLWGVLGDPVRIPINVAYYGWGMLMYLGWFLAPMILLAGGWKQKAEPDQAQSLAVRVIMMLFLLVTAGYFLLRRSLMPVHNNVIIPQGIGPLTLRDIFDLKLPHVPMVSVYFWIAVTVISLAGAIYLVVKFTRFVSDRFPNGRFIPKTDRDVIGIFFLLAALIYLIPFLMSGYFDRYLLPVLAFLLAFLACVWVEAAPVFSRGKIAGAILLIVGTGVFGVVATRDYMTWNRVRWDAVHTLLKQPEVKPEDVDGGFEVNGWYLFNNASGTTNWASSVKYVVAFGPIEGFEPVATNTYNHWLPSHEGQILILKRQSDF